MRVTYSRLAGAPRKSAWLFRTLRSIVLQRRDEACLDQGMLGFLILALATVAAFPSAWADSAAFDLAGPKLEMNVTRSDKTLTIARFPTCNQ
jgi:hypothetical protein